MQCDDVTLAAPGNPGGAATCTKEAGEEQGGGEGHVPEDGWGCGECPSQAEGHLDTAGLLGESLSVCTIKSSFPQLP